jgi:hypothetical protein
MDDSACRGCAAVARRDFLRDAAAGALATIEGVSLDVVLEPGDAAVEGF